MFGVQYAQMIYFYKKRFFPGNPDASYIQKMYESKSKTFQYINKGELIFDNGQDPEPYNDCAHPNYKISKIPLQPGAHLKSQENQWRSD